MKTERNITPVTLWMNMVSYRTNYSETCKKQNHFLRMTEEDDDEQEDDEVKGQQSRNKCRPIHRGRV